MMFYYLYLEEERDTTTIASRSPAIWSETARKNVAKAVKRTEILDDRQPSKNRNVTPDKTTIKYISKPEATAICVIDSQLGYRPDLEKGDTFLVVDCGFQVHTPPPTLPPAPAPAPIAPTPSDLAPAPTPPKGPYPRTKNAALRVDALDVDSHAKKTYKTTIKKFSLPNGRGKFDVMEGIGPLVVRSLPDQRSSAAPGYPVDLSQCIAGTWSNIRSPTSFTKEGVERGQPEAG
ncbi:hypothetical protein PG984_002581 [Apiospora sp. TS-2023a]